MSIQTPSWSFIKIVGQPVFTKKLPPAETWSRFPLLIPARGVGFGIGGFGIGGFGGNAASVSGLSQPVWSKETTK